MLETDSFEKTDSRVQTPLPLLTGVVRRIIIDHDERNEI